MLAPRRRDLARPEAARPVAPFQRKRALGRTRQSPVPSCSSRHPHPLCQAFLDHTLPTRHRPTVRLGPPARLEGAANHHNAPAFLAVKTRSAGTDRRAARREAGEDDRCRLPRWPAVAGHGQHGSNFVFSPCASAIVTALEQRRRNACSNFAPVAQLDRALASGAKGRAFESHRACHFPSGPDRPSSAVKARGRSADRRSRPPLPVSRMRTRNRQARGFSPRP